MKLLLVHRYIRPDAPGYAHMLYIMGQHFAATGYEVTIFSAQPSYNDAYEGPPLPRRERVSGMTIIRTPLLRESKKSALLRSLNFVLFSISLLMHAVIRWHPYDVMTVTTFPPTLMGSVARTIGFLRNTRYIYHCLDLYPEIALASGIVKRPWLGKIAAAIDKRNCKKASAVVVLSDDMRRTIGDRGCDTNNVEVINNFIIDEIKEIDDNENDQLRDLLATVPAEIRNNPPKFRVLFAGNIGRFQSLDTVVDAANILAKESEIEFLFVGSGVMKKELLAQASEVVGTTVKFHPYLPIKTVMGVIAESHLGIVSLIPNVINSAYPSKTMSYLEAGCKLLCIVEPNSELAHMAIQQQLGVVCDRPTGERVAAAVLHEYQIWKTNQYDRGQIQRSGRQLFSQKVILARWSQLLSNVST